MEETLIYGRRWYTKKTLMYGRVADLQKSCWSTEESLMYGRDADLQKRRWCTKETLIYGRDVDIRKRHWYMGEMLLYRSWYVEEMLIHLSKATLHNIVSNALSQKSTHHHHHHHHHLHHHHHHHHHHHLHKYRCKISEVHPKLDAVPSNSDARSRTRQIRYSWVTDSSQTDQIFCLDSFKSVRSYSSFLDSFKSFDTKFVNPCPMDKNPL